MSLADGAAVRLERVRWQYGGGPSSFCLRLESLAVGPGARVACIGPSGSGKSTLVNLMSGVITPQEGEVWLAGQRLGGLTPGERRRLRLERVGMVFQEFELLEYLSVRENLLLTQTLLHGRAGREAQERAGMLADRAGIGRYMDRKPRRLSQGERQRVAICRALVSPVALLLCDEPTGNLDPGTTGAMLDLMLGAASDLGAAIVMVTHNHGLLDRFGSVIDMERLSMAAEGVAA